MPTQKKIDQVEELSEKPVRATITVATDPTGQPVNTMTDLRRKMRERQVEYLVVKNTLAYLAADASDNPQVKEIIQGPTALALGYDNPVEVAKALEEYIRVNRSTLTIRGAVFNGKRLSSDEVITLSRPSRPGGIDRPAHGPAAGAHRQPGRPPSGPVTETAGRPVRAPRFPGDPCCNRGSNNSDLKTRRLSLEKR